MPVKANWHPPELLVDDSDPFADEQPPAPVTEVGVPIDLAAGEPELFAQLQRLLEAERALYEQQITCAVKDRADTSCHACPLAGRHGALCDVGRRQEAVLTSIAVVGLGE